MSPLNRFSEDQIIAKIQFENQWWETGEVDSFYTSMKRRLYFDLFSKLVDEKNIKRAVVLMGPRRVGKTVLLFHKVQQLIDSGIPPKRICYLSIENPIYNGMSLEEMLLLFIQSTKQKPKDQLYIFFDEIQYLKDWEVHLKSLVDSYHNIKFVVSGSAAAALKLKSDESGAGRFTDFVLPPLTFNEYLNLKGLSGLVLTKVDEILGPDAVIPYSDRISDLNQHFIDYINYGGYPEVSLSKEIQQNPSRYIKNDIIDKVLLRDLPSLYGIQDVQELNSLFTTIAYNTGNEFSYEELSVGSGVAKNTIKKYVEYLEAAFLIKRIERIDNNAKKFKRATYFKIYLTNPSLRTALFSPIKEVDSFMGNMVESAIFAQWAHNPTRKLYYARWKNGEVDIVGLEATNQKPQWVAEIKWSDKYPDNPERLKSLNNFIQKNFLPFVVVTSKTIQKSVARKNTLFWFQPSSLYCYQVGKNAIKNRSMSLASDIGE